MKKLPIFLIALLFSVSAFAQSGYQLGQKVNDFTLKDSKGQDVSLSNFKELKTVVLVFTNNQCPYAKLYEKRLVNLNNLYQDRGVRFIFVNPTLGQTGESVAEMQQKVTDANIHFPYLADEGQQVSQAFGATKTPEVFVLHNNNGEFFLKYKGAIDDNPQLESGVKENYLKNAIEAVLSNRNIEAFDKRATGCLIKKY